MRYDIAFLKGDQAGMEREVALGSGKVRSGRLDLRPGGSCPGVFRSLATGQEMSRRAVDLAQQAGQRERAALFEAGAAVWEALFGNAPEARRSAMAALELSKDRDVEYGAAFALAACGGFFRVSNARERSGKALPGGYVGPIQLPAGASRTSRAEPWRAFEGDRTAASRRSL